MGMWTLETFPSLFNVQIRCGSQHRTDRSNQADDLVTSNPTDDRHSQFHVDAYFLRTSIPGNIGGTDAAQDDSVKRARG